MFISTDASCQAAAIKFSLLYFSVQSWKNIFRRNLSNWVFSVTRETIKYSEGRYFPRIWGDLSISRSDPANLSPRALSRAAAWSPWRWTWSQWAGRAPSSLPSVTRQTTAPAPAPSRSPRARTRPTTPPCSPSSPGRPTRRSPPPAVSPRRWRASPSSTLTLTALSSWRLSHKWAWSPVGADELSVRVCILSQ